VDYFENVDHEILIQILKQKISDKRIIALIIIIILSNFSSSKGMPLGNLTSQFFANVDLNEMDQYIKHNLKVKNYIRYVDDFVIFSTNLQELNLIQEKNKSFS
jgi:retron-type reverse transcriptase